MNRPSSEWQARSPRHGVNLTAAGRPEGGSAFRVRITDISYDGCQIVSDEPLSVGERIFVIVPRMGEITAEVVWMKGERIGLSFVLEERSIKPAQVGR